MIAAYYYPSRHGSFVRIEKLDGGRRECLADKPCSGKREARKVAASFNAKPWNF